MNGVKKYFFLIVLFLGMCALYHKSLIGAGIQLVLKARFDCELAYRSVHWEKGELVFSDLVLFDSSFHSHIERASLEFDWSQFPKKLKGHLTVDSPHISVLKQRTFEKSSGEEGWIDFTVSVRNGTADWGGCVRYSLEHTKAESLLTLNWDDANVVVSLREGKLEAELKDFNARLLETWIPFGALTGGKVSGRIAMNEAFELHSANLKVANIECSLSMGSMENVSGTLSYHDAFGAKWEVGGVGQSMGKEFPFRWEGRGFFKRHWIESIVQFDQAFCQISGEETWAVECEALRFEHATWIQSGLSIAFPELASWQLLDGTFSGKGAFSYTSWHAQFEGKNLILNKDDLSIVCQEAKGEITQEGGNLILTSRDYDLKIAGLWDDWSAEARVGDLQFSAHGTWDGEKIPIEVETATLGPFTFSGKGALETNLNFSFLLDGICHVAQKKIPFHCPYVGKQGSEWGFDFRFVRDTWDLLRLAGTSDGKEVHYSEKCHFLGAPLRFAPTTLNELDVAVTLPWKSIQAIGPLLKEWGLDLTLVSPLSDTDLHFQYKGTDAFLSAKGSSPSFEFRAQQLSEGWKFDLESALSVQAIWQGGKAKGKAKWKTGIEVEFDGKIDSSFACEFQLPAVRFDLAEIKEANMEGTLEGQGHFIYNGQIQSDLDFTVSSLKIQSHAMENSGPIHLCYSSGKGAGFSGLNLHGPFDCIVDLLEYDAARSHWVFHNAQVHLPGSFLTHRLLRFLDKDRDLNFTADLDLASDFSSFVCEMQQALIPFNGDSHSIEDLTLEWRNGECLASMRYLNTAHRLKLHIDDQITGRLILGEEESPLQVDWEYGEKLSIQAIEGSFAGVEASFHAEAPDSLIGSARVNFTELSRWIPPAVAEVFHEIKMGQGYELKGHLKIEKNKPYFKGILSGKQLELFGFQFRTLLAQVDLSAEKIHIYDVKISDTAGIMKIDQILIEDKDPWTIEIPTLSMHEFRPSLLLRPGGTVGPISPLVVRELKMTDFKGLLADGKTYTAKGDLRFINSYKREETVFDIPANVLSRIVGLDFELLIPVTGEGEFELKNGFFNLTEFKNAYSEGKRSQFFLEMDPQPSMDLDGNLNIYIKMKQFVLLKFTESFLISIDGRIDDPQFHLKKRRFFGLM